MPVLDPDGLAEIVGFTAEDWFARILTTVLDADGVREILGTDGQPRKAIVYKASLEGLAQFFTITAESIIFDEEQNNARYKVSYVEQTEFPRSIFKFTIDE